MEGELDEHQKGEDLHAMTGEPVDDGADGRSGGLIGHIEG